MRLTERVAAIAPEPRLTALRQCRVAHRGQFTPGPRRPRVFNVPSPNPPGVWCIFDNTAASVAFENALQLQRLFGALRSNGLTTQRL